MLKLNKKSQAGYSLIQIAIAMVVLGIFIAAAGKSYVVYLNGKQITTTLENIEDVRIALQSYRERLGVYPCPSRMDINRNNPDYGARTSCDGGPDDDHDHMPPGDCGDGICIETVVDGTAYVMTNGQNVTPPARALTNARVRVGAIPFRELQIDEKSTIDGYGSKLLYAVTESLTDRDTFNDANGAVHIVNALGESLVDPPGSAPFVIVSTGPNELGAYSSEGAQVVPCSGAVLDAENCRNFDPASLITPPILPVTPPFALYAADYRVDADNNNSFDDIVEFFSKEDTPKWQRTDGDVESIRALVEDGVGVGTNEITNALVIPQKVTNYDADDNPGTPPVEHDGALRATGELRTTRICDENGANCFDPDLLGGTTMMSCPPGEYMIGFGNNGPICDDVRVYCPNNSQPIMTGLNADGSPICMARPLNGCTNPVQLCSGSPLVANRRNSNQTGITRPIAATGSHGQTMMITDTGSYSVNPRRSNFTCNNGVWQHNSSTQFGLCSCTVPPATTRTVNLACPGQSPSGNAAIRDETWNAMNCAWNTSGAINYTACACPGPTTPQPAPVNNSCGAGYNSGNNTTTYTFNNANNVCNWVGSNTNNCTCDPAVAGTTNGGTRTLTTPVACNTVPGFASFTGNAYRIQTFNGTPGTCAWQNTGWDTSACACDTTTEYPTAAPASPCTSCQDETTAAVWVYRNQVSGGACVPGPAYQRSPAVCQDISFRWRSTSATPLGPPGNSAGTRPEVNSACSCEDRSTSRTCYNETSPGVFYFYSCTCNR